MSDVAIKEICGTAALIVFLLVMGWIFTRRD